MQHSITFKRERRRHPRMLSETNCAVQWQRVGSLHARELATAAHVSPMMLPDDAIGPAAPLPAPFACIRLLSVCDPGMALTPPGDGWDGGGSDCSDDDNGQRGRVSLPSRPSLSLSASSSGHHEHDEWVRQLSSTQCGDRNSNVMRHTHASSFRALLVRRNLRITQRALWLLCCRTWIARCTRAL